MWLWERFVDGSGVFLASSQAWVAWGNGEADKYGMASLVSSKVSVEKSGHLTIEVFEIPWRVQSIQDGKDTLPCSLIACVGDRVVGHVRVLEVLGKEGAVIVESLLVDPSVRGRGLGRKLMEDAENLARSWVLRARTFNLWITMGVVWRFSLTHSLGCKTVHLSTHDQQAFYQHLGYQEAAPVTGARKCLTKLKTQASDHEVRPSVTTCWAETEWHTHFF